MTPSQAMIEAVAEAIAVFRRQKPRQLGHLKETTLHTEKNTTEPLV